MDDAITRGERGWRDGSGGDTRGKVREGEDVVQVKTGGEAWGEERCGEEQR